MYKAILKHTLRIGLPLLLAAVILHWMYDGVDWGAVWAVLDGGMNWWWMLLSMPFGVSAQVFRALRWRVALRPLGERPRLSTCCHSIFLSYASSLAIPRVGEVLRCGVLARYEGISFTRLVGSVVSERIVDMSMVLLFSLVTLATQVPVFLRFFDETGLDPVGFLSGLTATGYLVTAVCALAACVLMAMLLRKLEWVSRTRAKLAKLTEGMAAVARLHSPWRFLLYSAGISGKLLFAFLCSLLLLRLHRIVGPRGGTRGLCAGMLCRAGTHPQRRRPVALCGEDRPGALWRAGQRCRRLCPDSAHAPDPAHRPPRPLCPGRPHYHEAGGGTRCGGGRAIGPINLFYRRTRIRPVEGWGMP